MFTNAPPGPTVMLTPDFERLSLRPFIIPMLFLYLTGFLLGSQPRGLLFLFPSWVHPPRHSSAAPCFPQIDLHLCFDRHE